MGVLSAVVTMGLLTTLWTVRLLAAVGTVGLLFLRMLRADGSIWGFRLASKRLLRLSVGRIRLATIVVGLLGLAIRVFRLAAMWLFRLPAVTMRLLGLAAVGVLVLVFWDIVLVTIFVKERPRALFAALVTHRHCLAETVVVALLLFATLEHEIARL
jgi:hypothetical protein